MEKMNRLFLWGLLIALIVGFAACSDDDNPEGGDGTGIVSKWRYEQPGGEYITEIRFNADGTFTEMEKEYYRSAGEWRTRNNEGTYVYDEEAEELTEAEGRDEAVWECADVLYFLSVLMYQENVSWKDVLDELDRRHKK